MVLLLLLVICGAAWIYFAVTHERQEIRDAVSRGEFEIPLSTSTEVATEDWRELYPSTVPIIIGDKRVLASVADSLPERIKGLSDTPFLPKDVVKLFVFDVSDYHSIWMKSMNYSLDILWVTEAGKIVHIEENVSPNTYPKSFAAPIPSWFVIETNAGFVAENNIEVGDELLLAR